MKTSVTCYLHPEKPRQNFVCRLKILQCRQLLTGWRDKNTCYQQAWNVKRHINYSLAKKWEVLFTCLKTKQAQSLTTWRAKDNHFQQAWKQSKPSHSQSGEPRTTIFSRLESKASPVTHKLESQGQPFSAGLKAKQEIGRAHVWTPVTA